MSTELKFDSMSIMGSELGAPTNVPDLVGDSNFQNKNHFDLDDDQGIFERYGTLRSSYPYPQFNGYNRSLKPITYQTAVLENEYVRAVFLPELGGRLWQLYDKQHDRDILYTNDVLRFSNLAIRNAWFSGGAEWNISMIGHSPYTTEPLYTAKLEAEDGNPILRMYEYERVRHVEYQMDFWLERNSLRCRMRISNTGRDVVPMYWWSNIAVPEFTGGRLVVPAKSAYVSGGRDVEKRSFPMDNGKDMSFYAHTNAMIDYFFDEDHSKPSYIANLSPDGYGFLHLASNRMQSHKLFSWGHDRNGDRWQAFLTCRAGKYIELQGGLGKTQYGCIPMPPNTAWEWSEVFAPLDFDPTLLELPYDKLENEMSRHVQNMGWNVEEKMPFTRMPAEVVFPGSGYGRLQNVLRTAAHERPLSTHLHYEGTKGGADFWLQYLQKDKLPEISPEDAPLDFICDGELFAQLQKSSQAADRENWYAWYQMGVYCVWKEKPDDAETYLLHSFRLAETPWACHALASLYLITGQKPLANLFMRRGIELRRHDLSYVKEGLRLLGMGGGYAEILAVWPLLTDSEQANDRLLYDYALALYKTGAAAQARQITEALPDMIDDIREGTDPVAVLKSVLAQVASER